MPVPDTLKVCELFASFQGEGCRYGISSIFLRLSGCHIGCPYCDTPESWGPGGERVALDDLMGRIGLLRADRPKAQLVITGGEPLEQDLGLLVERARDTGLFVAIETSGLLFQDLPVDWWAVAPKKHRDHHIHEALLPRVNEIKVVVQDKLGLEDIFQLRQRLPEVPIFLQPDVYNQGQQAYAQVLNLADQADRAGIPAVRVGMQLHRIYGAP
jgi:organic radical activating enzyme